MKSFQCELKAIEHSINVKSARALLFDNTRESFEPRSNQSSFHEYNIFKNQKTNYMPTSSQKYTWQGLSFNQPNSLIKVSDFNPTSPKKICLTARPITSRPITSRPTTARPMTARTMISTKSSPKILSPNFLSQHTCNTFRSVCESDGKKTNQVQENSQSKEEQAKIKERQISDEKRTNAMKKNIKEYDFLKLNLDEFYQRTEDEKDRQQVLNSSKKGEGTPPALITEVRKTFRKTPVSELAQKEKKYEMDKKRTREQNSHYLKKLYSIQKSALSSYLIGDNIQAEVIQSHKEIINPLQSFVEQRRREARLQIYLKKNHIIQNDRNTTRPVFQSHEAAVKETILTQPRAKVFKLKEKPYNISLGMKKKNSSASKKIEKDIEEQKEQKYNFLKVFLKGEGAYFKRLDDLVKGSSNEFKNQMNVTQKYLFEQLVQPEQQFVTHDDLKTERNFGQLKELRSQLSPSGSLYYPSTQQPIKQWQNSLTERKPDSVYSQSHKANTLKSQRRINQELQSQGSHEEETKKGKKAKIDALLDDFEAKEDDKFQELKQPLLLNAKMSSSIAQMNSQKQFLLQNIEKISMLHPLQYQEKDIFNLVKHDMYKELEKILIFNTSIVDLQDETAKTPLHWAALRGNIKTVELLLKYKASVNALDMGNKQPKDLAFLQNHLKVYSVLSKEAKYLQSIAQSATNIIAHQQSQYQPVSDGYLSQKNIRMM